MSGICYFVCMTRLLFVCICGIRESATVPEMQRGNRGSGERASAANARHSAIRRGFCPCFWCASLFFCPLYFAPPRPRKPRRLGTRSFVKFYDGPRCALVSIILYALPGRVRPFFFTNFVLITGSSGRRTLRRAHTIARGG